MKNKKIFDIEKIGFGDELGEPVTANRLPKPQKPSAQAVHQPVAQLPKTRQPIIKQAKPAPAAPLPEVQKKTANKEEAFRFQAVEFISPISGSRRKKPSRLHLAHGQYSVDKQELVSKTNEAEDFTLLMEESEQQSKLQPEAANQKTSERKIFDVEAVSPSQASKEEENPETKRFKDEDFFAEVANVASKSEPAATYYELPKLALLSSESRLRNMLSQPAAMLEAHPLVVALGMDGQRGAFVNLGDAKHHLACASDPRVMNAMVLSLLFKAAPADLRLVMVDSQWQNLSAYSGLPHLAMPILQGQAHIGQGLDWLFAENQRRAQLFAMARVEDISSFNEARPTFSEELPRLPYLILVIDELETLDPALTSQLIDLMEMGPRAGIHVLGATVMEADAPICSRFPSRLVDGAWHYQEELAALQLPIVSLQEITETVAAAKSQMSLAFLFEPVVGEEPAKEIPLSETSLEAEVPKEEVSELLTVAQVVADFPEPRAKEEAPEALANISVDSKPIEFSELVEAIGLFLERQEATISLLQVQREISYGRAVKIMDELQKQGWVQKDEASAKREITMTEQEYMEITAKATA